MSQYYDVKKLYCIYAIHTPIIEDYPESWNMYVGQSAAKDPRDRMYAHRRGENIYTKKYFEGIEDLTFTILDDYMGLPNVVGDITGKVIITVRAEQID